MEKTIFIDCLSNFITGSFLNQKNGYKMTNLNKRDFIWNVIVQMTATEPNKYLYTGDENMDIESLIKSDKGLTNFLGRLFHAHSVEFRDAFLWICEQKPEFKHTLCTAFMNEDEIDRIRLMFGSMLAFPFNLSREKYKFMQKIEQLFKQKTNDSFNLLLPWHVIQACHKKVSTAMQLEVIKDENKFVGLERNYLESLLFPLRNKQLRKSIQFSATEPGTILYLALTIAGDCAVFTKKKFSIIQFTNIFHFLKNVTNKMNWVTPLIIAMGKEIEYDLNLVFKKLGIAIKFVGDFGFPDPLTGCHLNTIHLGAFDLKFWQAMDGGGTNRSQYNLRKNDTPKQEQFDFNLYLPQNVDSGGREERANKFKTSSQRRANAEDNKGQRGLCIWANCFLSTFTEEEHEGNTVLGTTFGCFCQLTVACGTFDLYKKYLFEVLMIDNIEFDFQGNTDKIMLTIKQGNKRRKFQDCTELWIPSQGSVYSTVFDCKSFWYPYFCRLPNYVCEISIVYEWDANEIKYISPMSVMKKTLRPYIQIMNGMFRDKNIGTYLRMILREIPLKIIYAQKLNLPVKGTFSSGLLEKDWCNYKWIVRNDTNKFKGINNLQPSGPDNLTNNCRPTIEKLFSIKFWSMLCDDKEKLLLSCLTETERKELQQSINDTKDDDNSDDDSDDEKQIVIHIFDDIAENLILEAHLDTDSESDSDILNMEYSVSDNEISSFEDTISIDDSKRKKKKIKTYQRNHNSNKRPHQKRKKRRMINNKIEDIENKDNNIDLDDGAKMEALCDELAELALKPENYKHHLKIARKLSAILITFCKNRTQDILEYCNCPREMEKTIFIDCLSNFITGSFLNQKNGYKMT
eukprot:78576_1